MAKQIEHVCDACADDGEDVTGHPVYLGFAKTWWQLDLCQNHQVSLLGDLEALLDSAGAPVPGPALHLE